MVWDKPRKDELTDFDRSIIGPARIITIPLEDRHLLREIGDMLAGLGRDMMFHAERMELPPRDLAVTVSNRINEVNNRIRNRATECGVKMPRRGRKAKEKLKQTQSETEIVSLSTPHQLYKNKYRR